MRLRETLTIETTEDGGEVGGEAGGEEGVFLVGADDIGGGSEGIGECLGRRRGFLGA